MVELVYDGFVDVDDDCLVYFGVFDGVYFDLLVFVFCCLSFFYDLVFLICFGDWCYWVCVLEGF